MVFIIIKIFYAGSRCRIYKNLVPFRKVRIQCFALFCNKKKKIPSSGKSNALNET